MKNKFIFVGLVIRQGAFTYNTNKVYEIPEEIDTLKFSEQTVINYHADQPFQKEEEYNWWYFYGGQIAVMLETAEEITREEYDILNKFQYK